MARKFEEWGNRALASTIGSVSTPKVGVSERTQATYDNGARHLARHLLDGEWSEDDRLFIPELLYRAIANAKRQGIELKESTEATPTSQEEFIVTSGHVYTEVSLMVYGLGKTEQLTPRFIASHLSKPALEWARGLSHGPDETFRDTLMHMLHNEGVIGWDSINGHNLGDLGSALVESYLSSMSPTE